MNEVLLLLLLIGGEHGFENIWKFVAKKNLWFHFLVFFPMFLSFCVTYIIFFFFLHLLPGPSEWSALIGTGMEGECMLVWFCKKKSPCGNFPIWKNAFFMHRKKHFLWKKIIAAFEK